MEFSWNALVAAFNRLAHEGTPKRKLLQLVSIILVVEGLSVLILFSYQGAIVGLLSLALGGFLMLLLNPGPYLTSARRPEAVGGVGQKPGEASPGIKLIRWIMARLNNDYIVMVAGATVIVLVVVWNLYFSERPSFGDLDTLTMVFGGLLVVFPLIVEKFEAEGSFSLLFLGFVVLFLVVPQAVLALHSDTGSSIGNSYVEYMLAAPFAGVLNLVGIDADSHGNMVNIQFHDGSTQALAISAYCAGLYSFSIFLAAFFSFVLVFERLPGRVLAFVLALGLMIAYLGNLFRMVIIGIVGYYEGIDALLWTHENVGWIIFLSWSAVFWFFLLGYVSKHSTSRRTGDAS
jgi:exosortase/archaeosortase family protein